MDTLSDIGRAIRSLRRTPGFTLAALAILALGIGANAAIFTVINAVLIDRLPYPEADRIVDVARSGSGQISEPVSGYWEQNNAVLDDLAAYRANASINLNGGSLPELVEAIAASRNYFRLFGANPIMGRTFTAQEDVPGGPRVLILSYGLWQRRFGGDPSILGRKVSLGGAPHSVVGILAPNFHPPQQHLQGVRPGASADVWIPLQADPNSTNEAGILTVAGRLPTGITLAEANARIAVVMKRYLETSSRAFRADPRIHVASMKDQLTGDAKRPLLILLRLTRMLESQLFGVRPSDPWTYVLAPTILIAIALAGAYFPARRAASVDPAVALRHS